MPEIPGPPAGYDEEQRRIWFEGAAAVAKLQAHQWSIIADQYDQAAEGLLSESDADGVDAAVKPPEPPSDSEEDDDGCPECGEGALVDGLGGLHCPNCGHTEESSS